ncbi:heat shock protein 70 family, partial [Pavlovales sp. CCMP2436]
VGGEMHDEALVEQLASEFQREHGIDLRVDAFALSRLLDGAEKARHELSSAPATAVSLPFITADAKGPKHLHRELSRSEFEAAADGALGGFSLERLCLDALADAGVDKAQLGALLLTGGMMRTPHLRARVERAVGQCALDVGLNPEDACAVGAAL